MGLLTFGAWITTLAVVPLGAAEAPATEGRSGWTSVCLDCHDEQSASLQQGPHAVLVGENDDMSTRISCTSCHVGSASHFEDDPEVNPMANPAQLDVGGVGAVCASCHNGVHQTNQRTLSAHAAAGITCLECHQIHAPAVLTGQLKQSQPGLCYICHVGVRGQFAQPSHHPVSEGAVSCDDCHLAGDDGMATLALDGGNAACYMCHKQFQGPFPFEHQATVDYSVEGDGCVTCHDPHGSAQPCMLNQPYTAPHFQLCSQCHSVPRHNFNSQHGTDFAGVSCAECHTDIHGSYTNRLFLTPALAAQGCLSVGCHGQ